MPPKKNKPKKDTAPKPKGGKRKNISPLFSDNTHSVHNTDYTDKTGSASSTRVIDQPDSGNIVSSESKRFHPSSPEYFIFDMNNMAMICPQPYGGQFMQSAQHTPQLSAVPPVVSPTSQPPNWATTIIDDIKSIKISVARIESVEKTVNSINLKMSELETKVQVIDKRVTDVERASTFLNGQHEIHTDEFKSTIEEVKNLEKSCTNLKNNLRSLEEEKANMSSKISDLEFRSMKENLIFYGIPEPPVESSMRSGATEVIMGEDGEVGPIYKSCEHLVKQFIKDKIKIDAEHMIFDRVHRMGDASK